MTLLSVLLLEVFESFAFVPWDISLMSNERKPACIKKHLPSRNIHTPLPGRDPEQCLGRP